MFALARWRNENVPSGGWALRPCHSAKHYQQTAQRRTAPDQKDEDSLPPYDALDDILFAPVEDELGVDEIIARGHDAETVKRIEHLLYVSEYKRRQAAPGAKIGNRNFGRDRCHPITNGFRDARAEFKEFMTVRTRFAPSPTGMLHVGNARAALFVFCSPKGRAISFCAWTILMRRAQQKNLLRP